MTAEMSAAPKKRQKTVTHRHMLQHIDQYVLYRNVPHLCSKCTNGAEAGTLADVSSSVLVLNNSIIAKYKTISLYKPRLSVWPFGCVGEQRTVINIKS